MPAQSPGNTPAEFQSACETVAGKNYEGFFDRFVRSRTELDLDPFLTVTAVPPSEVGPETGTIIEARFEEFSMDTGCSPRVYIGPDAGKSFSNAANIDYTRPYGILANYIGTWMTTTADVPQDVMNLSVMADPRICPGWKVNLNWIVSS